MNRESHHPQSVSFADDQRARVPFAVIGVLLLLVSVTAVTVVETKSDPVPDVDVEQAVDEALGVSQNAVRDAVREAAQAAAREPVTVVANTPAGNALSDGSEPVFRQYLKLRAYLKAKRKLEDTTHSISDNTVAEVSLPSVRFQQSSINDAISRVSLSTLSDPSVDAGTLKATINDISISVKRDGHVVAEDSADITVTIGTAVFALHRKTETYQNRLQMGFFDPSDAASLRGMGRKFAAMIYPWAYFKAGAERARGTLGEEWKFESIVENYESTTFANAANLWIQNETFGTRAQGSTAQLAGGFVCLATKTVKKLTSSRSSWGSRASTVCGAARAIFSGSSLRETFKRKLTNRGIPGLLSYLQTTSRQRASTGDQSSQVEDITIHIRDAADPAYEQATGGTYDWDQHNRLGQVRDENVNEAKDGGENDEDYPEDFSEDTINAVINDIYTVDAWANVQSVTGDSPSFNIPSPSPPSSGSWDKDGTSKSTTVNTYTISKETTWDDSANDGQRDRPYFRYTINIRNKVTKTQDWTRDCSNVPRGTSCDSSDSAQTSDYDYVDYTAEIVVGGTHSAGDELDGMDYPDPMVDALGVTNAYTAGGSESRPTGTANGDTPYTPDNFEPALEKAVENTLRPVGDATSATSQLKSSLDASRVSGESDLRTKLNNKIRASQTISITPTNRNQLESWLKNEVQQTHSLLKSEVGSITVKPRKMVTGQPFEQLRDKVDSEHNAHDFVYRNQNGYATAPDKALALLRRSYLADVHDWIDEQQSQRDEGNQELDRIGNNNAGGPLSDFFSFLDNLNSGSGDLRIDFSFERPGTVDSDLQDDPLNYKIHSAPGYLTSKPVTRSAVPAVRPEGETASDPENTLYAPFAAKNKAHLPSPGIPLLPYPSWWYASVNFWNVQIEGKYPRFAVTASTGTPGTAPSTTYVRQAQPVKVKINGIKRSVGSVEPIQFSADTLVAIAMPGASVMPQGSWGTGDRYLTEPKPKHSREECTPAWGNIGPGFSTATPKAVNCASGQQGSVSTFILSSASSGTAVNLAALADDDTNGGDICDEEDPDESDDDDNAGDPGCGDLAEMEMHVFNVGKGQAILVQGPSATGGTVNTLIDAGARAWTGSPGMGESEVAEEIYDEIAIDDDDLVEESSAEIDNLIVTHNHEDHAVMLEEILDDSDIDASSIDIYSNGVDDSDLMGYLPSRFDQSDLETLREGDGSTVNLGVGVSLDVYNPPSAGDRSTSNSMPCDNNMDDCNSIVMKLGYSGEDFLLISDIRKKVERDLIGSGAYKGVEVLQMSHHASASANSEEMYETVSEYSDPVSLLISNANRPGQSSRHPQLDAIQNANEALPNVPVHWTYYHGTISYEADAAGIEVSWETAVPGITPSQVVTMIP